MISWISPLISLGGTEPQFRPTGNREDPQQARLPLAVSPSAQTGADARGLRREGIAPSLPRVEPRGVLDMIE